MSEKKDSVIIEQTEEQHENRGNIKNNFEESPSINSVTNSITLEKSADILDINVDKLKQIEEQHSNKNPTNEIINMCEKIESIEQNSNFSQHQIAKENTNNQNLVDNSIVQGNHQEQVNSLPMPTSRFQPQKLLLVIFICIAVIITGIGSYIVYEKNSKHKILLQAYNKDFNTISTDARVFAQKANTGAVDKRNNLKSVIQFYLDLDASNKFEASIKQLNAKPEYSALEADYKKNLSDLAIDSEIVELKTIMKDIDKMQVIIQKSDNIDTEIDILQNSTSTTIKQYEEKIKELITTNTSIKNDMLSISAHEKIKFSQDKLIEAINYREKYLQELDSSNQAYLDYLLAEDNYKYYLDLAVKYKEKGDSSYSYYTSSTYYNMAREAVDKMTEYKSKMNEKFATKTVHKNAAEEFLNKYKKIMNINTKDLIIS